MATMNKQYTKGDITVIWKPDQCIHSKLCWTELRDVFDPRKRPWVNMEGADEARIAEQVERCPSGALSYIMKKQESGDSNTSAEVTTTVEVLPNGPLMVYGKLTVKDANGQTHDKNKVTAFCRCGASGNKPFCDGSHIKIEFRD